MVRCVEIVLLALLLAGCDPGSMEDGPIPDQGVPDGWGGPPPLLINEMQVRGTVNSYHDFDYPVYPEMAYRHLPLDEQAALQGIRQFDFDVEGDRPGQLDLDPRATERRYDPLNHCGSLLTCLWQLAAWMEAHPNHPLVVVFIGETEVHPTLEPQIHRQLDMMEEWLLFGISGPPPVEYRRDRILAPGDVRRGAPSLLDALRRWGWPSIDETRGKVMFVLNDRGLAREEYIANGGLDPDDRLMFIVGDPDTAGEAAPDEVIFTFDERVPLEFETDPAALPRIRELAEAGFLVHAITDDPEMAEGLRAAGAHMIGTRFPEILGPMEPTPVWCNPVTAQAHCDPRSIEPPGP